MSSVLRIDACCKQMLVNIVRSLIILFWLLMTGWLIRYEAFPCWFTAAAPGYRVFFKNGPLILDTWMQIEFRNNPVGYSHTWVDSDMASPNATCIICPPDAGFTLSRDHAGCSIRGRPPRSL